MNAERAESPTLSERWLKELLKGPLPQESRATCTDCAMCPSKSIWHTKSDHYFDRTLKCCTYMPVLPNFLAGMILLDEDASVDHGRRALQAQIRAGVDVTPSGVKQSISYLKTVQEDPNGFGTNKNLICPYYIMESGRCGIWPYRNSRCATFFCKFEHGITSLAFWKDVDRLLNTIEKDLAEWCILQLFSRRNGSSDSIVQSDGWGNWCGRKIEFFMECARLVAPLCWSDIHSISVSSQILARQTTYGYGKLKWNPLPSRLVLGNIRKVEQSINGYRIWSYSIYDPLDLPELEAKALLCFDGRPTDEVRDSIHRETGVHFDEPFLRKLLDFGILRAG